jgi:uncharacterized protein
MLKLLFSGIALCAFLSVAIAGPFEDGISAYQQGDIATALRIWTPLAEDGDAIAQTNLGSIYANGEGVARDDEAARKWYRLAAEQGDAIAQYNLGFIYRSGRNVPQDDGEAAKWYRLAAKQGHAVAQASLGTMYYRGQGVAKDNILAHLWLNLAALQNEPMTAELRDLITTKMTSEQIAEAWRLAREWKEKLEL